METLHQIEQRLREAVLEGGYDEVCLAASDYRQRFDAEWHSMTVEEKRHSELHLHAMELTGWALDAVKISRALLAERRRTFTMAGHYLQNGFEARNQTWGTAG
jgi:hypothetical protein